MLKATGIATIALVVGAAAAPSPIARTVLQKLEVPDGRYVTELGRGVYPPFAKVPRHTHPGVEMGYIEEGEALIHIDGEPDRRLSRGDSFSVPPTVPHSMDNLVGTNLIVLDTATVEKDKPYSSPAP